MIIQNSYIFLSFKLNENKEMFKNKEEQSQDFYYFYDRFLKDECFIKLKTGHKNDDFFNQIEEYRYISNNVDSNIKFSIHYIMGGIVYFDIIVDSKNKSKCIQTMEDIHSKLLLSGIKKEYIDIVSYDSVSEYYCNKILKKLNTLERNIRKLLFNVYTIKFGLSFYEKTIKADSSLTNKIKGKIRQDNKGATTIRDYGVPGKEAKEIAIIQNFFYSLTFSDLNDLLFKQKWTEYEENFKINFENNHPDFSELSHEELLTAFNYLRPKSDWNRLFESKIKLKDIETLLDSVREYRNAAAHFKFFYKKDYEIANKLINKLNRAILDAIVLTEKEDFVEKNSEELTKMFKPIFELQERIKESLKPTLDVLKHAAEYGKSLVDSLRIGTSYLAENGLSTLFNDEQELEEKN